MLCLLLVLSCAAVLRARHGGQAADAGSVQYAAGWNLIAVTSGTPLDAAQGPAYVIGPSGYEAVSTRDLVAGRAAWVYFPQGATISLGKSAAEYSRTSLPAGAQALVGNPSPTLSVPVSGADLALVYDSRMGYLPATELRPGQGAVVYSAAGGTVTLGKPPAGAATEELDRVRAALVASPADRGTLEELAQAGEVLLRSRSYDQAQTAVDDMRAAQEQGLRSQGSGPLPPLTTLEQNSAATVREALAQAKAALADGNTAGADAAAGQALRAAQAAVDDAMAIARGDGSADSDGSSRTYAAAGGTLNALAAVGTLLRGASFAFALGIAPGDDFWNLVQQLQSGQLTLPDTTLQPGPAGLPPVLPPPPPPPTSLCPIDPARLVLDPEELNMLALMNALRAQQGLPALQISIALQRTAASKVAEMAATHVYQHDPEFPVSDPRFANCGYPPDAIAIGENLNGGHADAATVFADWNSDPAHRDDMLNPNFLYVGIKRLKLPDPSDPLGWLWAADFGSEPDPG